MASLVARPDVVCLSHLRWGSVYQRPQQLMSRFGRHGRVFFCEEPLLGEALNPRLEVKAASEGVFVVQPMLPAGLEPEALDIVQGILLNAMMHEMDVRSYVLWYYAPLAVRFTQYFNPIAVVYDCMDELTGFKDASAELPERERELLARSDLVFTGGQSLYEAKRRLHARVHAFPSSVDVPHFARARALRGAQETDGQSPIPHPGDRADEGLWRAVDDRLRGISWDRTWEAMDALLGEVLAEKAAALRPTLRRRIRHVAAAKELH